MLAGSPARYARNDRLDDSRIPRVLGMLGNTVKTFRGIIVARVPLAGGIVVK